MKSDFVFGLNFGDEGKAKVIYQLLKDNKYTHVWRGQGSNNCGHTLYHNGVKFITHMIPAGVFFNLPSLIGPGCVLNIKSFFGELEKLEQRGVQASKFVKIAYNCHIVTEGHIAEENSESVLGTTRSGVGPCYRDKYARIGKRAEDFAELKEYLIDFGQEINKPDNVLLFEGAQAYGLTIDSPYYPFVTSCDCTIAGALANGIPPSSIRTIYGTIKAYSTYVGNRIFQGDDPIFAKMQVVGKERGAKTDRVRQCNFLDIDQTKEAVYINDVNILVVNKMDILQQLNCWKVRNKNNEVTDLGSEENFKAYLLNEFPGLEILFSYSPEHI